MKFRKLIATLALIGCAATPLNSSAAALPGEVEKILPYTPYGEKTDSKIRIVLPEKYKDYEPVPYTSQYEDKFSQWMIYKPVTLDGVNYTWANIYSFTEKEQKDNKRNGIDYEYALIPNENPYTQKGIPEIEQTPQASDAKRNSFNQAGLDATKMRVYANGKVRSFKTAYYPKLQLSGPSYGIDAPNDKIPMVGIREFVESTDNLSLVWDNGTIHVTNSETGKVTDFCIYNKGGIKATLINGTSYASLADLLKAEYGEEAYRNLRYEPGALSQFTSQDLIFLNAQELNETLQDYAKRVIKELSYMGILSCNFQKAPLANQYTISHSTISNTTPQFTDVSTGYTLYQDLEQLIEPSGCIYQNPIISFSTSYNDIEVWKGKMMDAVKDKTTDKEKAEALFYFLDDSFINYVDDIKIPNNDPNRTNTIEKKLDVAKSYKVNVPEGKYYGLDSDFQELFLLGCTMNNIPSVKLTVKYVGSDKGSNFVAAYYDGRWNYFNERSGEKVDRSLFVASDEKAKEKGMSTYITVSSYGGLVNENYTKSALSEEQLEALRIWSNRYAAIGYR